MKSVLTRQCPGICRIAIQARRADTSSTGSREAPVCLERTLKRPEKPTQTCGKPEGSLSELADSNSGWLIQIVSTLRAFCSSVSTIPGPHDPGMPCVCPQGLKHGKSTSIRSQQNTNPPSCRNVRRNVNRTVVDLLDFRNMHGAFVRLAHGGSAVTAKTTSRNVSIRPGYHFDLIVNVVLTQPQSSPPEIHAGAISSLTTHAALSFVPLPRIRCGQTYYLCNGTLSRFPRSNIIHEPGH